ncbi:MAG: DUF488 family protein [Chloroflexota bacterium]
MFREASVYDRKVAFDAPGHRVLTMRLWPRGVKKSSVHTWLQDAAPSRDLLDAYHAGLGWEQYATRYRAEILNERPHVLDELLCLEREHGLVWLLCTEKVPPEPHCHRFLLMELLLAAKLPS